MSEKQLGISEPEVKRYSAIDVQRFKNEWGSEKMRYIEKNRSLVTERDAYREGLEKIIDGWGTFSTAGADVHIELNKSALQDIANVVLSKYPKGESK